MKTRSQSPYFFMFFVYFRTFLHIFHIFAHKSKMADSSQEDNIVLMSTSSVSHYAGNHTRNKYMLYLLRV